MTSTLLSACHPATSSTPTLRQAESFHTGCTRAEATWPAHTSGTWLAAEGTVLKTLADAHGRYTHERFILRCGNGFTLLIVNDVDIGARVPVSPGESVIVRGQYIWNPQGGLIHFTHHDPEGALPGGWIAAGGKVYS